MNLSFDYSRAAPEDSKKWGMLNLVNQLFKIYFKVPVPCFGQLQLAFLCFRVFAVLCVHNYHVYILSRLRYNS